VLDVLGACVFGFSEALPSDEIPCPITSPRDDDVQDAGDSEPFIAARSRWCMVTLAGRKRKEKLGTDNPREREGGVSTAHSIVIFFVCVHNDRRWGFWQLLKYSTPVFGHSGYCPRHCMIAMIMYRESGNAGMHCSMVGQFFFLSCSPLTCFVP